jgi:hypothetical protein
MTTPFQNQSQSYEYITTDGQSASLSWNKAPICGLRPSFFYCRTSPVLLMWAALSDERASLPFTIAAGHRQRSHSRVRVPRDSWTIFYFLRFETPQTWRVRSSYLYPPRHWVSLSPPPTTLRAVACVGTQRKSHPVLLLKLIYRSDAYQ